MTNVLFICSKPRMRNPNAADVLIRWPGMNTDFAGFSCDADEVLTPKPVDWADMIFVIEPRQKTLLRTVIGQPASGLKAISLGILGRFDAHAPEPVRILIQKLTTYFGPLP